VRRYQAQMVWIGRRPEDEAIAAKRERLGQWGPVPQYIEADATDGSALRAASEQIQAQHGAIHGVVHAAIVLRDRSLGWMEEAGFASSLAAKVDTSVHLAEVFGPQVLDFVLFFSSLQSLTKAPGQSNYAAGCTFSDAYAQALRQAWPCAVKVVNWGYWGHVGVVASEEHHARMAEEGVGSIEPSEAWAHVERLLSSPVDQVVFIKTTRAEVAAQLGVAAEESVTVATEALPRVMEDVSARTALVIPRLSYSPARRAEALWREREAARAERA